MNKQFLNFTLLFGVLSGGCSTAMVDRPFIAPLDGQTNYPTTLPIRVNSSQIDIPMDYPMPDLIQVTNVDNGIAVPGNIIIDDDGVTFHPNDDWRPNRRYVWNVQIPTPVPHGPELSFPDHLLGAAVFDTTSRLKLLIGGVDQSDRTCVVFSRPIDQNDGGTVKVTINDIELDDAIFTQLGPEDLGPEYPLDIDDPGVSVVCLTTESPISAGGSLRLWWGSDGPWRVDLLEATPDELIEILRRGSN